MPYEEDIIEYAKKNPELSLDEIAVNTHCGIGLIRRLVKEKRIIKPRKKNNGYQKKGDSFPKKLEPELSEFYSTIKNETERLGKDFFVKEIHECKEQMFLDRLELEQKITFSRVGNQVLIKIKKTEE